MTIRIAFALLVLTALAAAPAEHQVRPAPPPPEPVLTVELDVAGAVHRAQLGVPDFASVPGPARAGLPLAGRAFRPLAADGGASAADVLAWGYWSPTDGPVLEVLIANGRVDLYRGRVDGLLTVTAAGGAVLAKASPVTLYDGGAVLLRLGRLTYHPVDGFPAWYVRAGPQAPWPAAITTALRNLLLPADDIPNTGAQGSPLGGRLRVVVGAWDVGLGLVALGAEDPASADVARLAGYAHRWTDQQARRSLLYYGPDGAAWRAMDDPGAIIGDQPQNGGGFCGLWSAKELHGRPAGGAGNPWRSFDHQHLEAHRLLVTWQLTGSEAARALGEAVLEAALSHPGVRAPKKQAFAGNQRAVAWPLRQYALAVRCFGLGARPQYETAIANLFEDVALSSGVAAYPYPSLAPKKADHANMEVCVWQTGLLAAGMAEAREVLGDGPDGRWAQLHEHVVSCLLGPGRQPGALFYGDYDPFSEARNPPASWVNGTSSWAGEWLLSSAPYFPDRAAEMAGLAAKLQAEGLQAGFAYKPSEALGVYWRSTGAFGLPGTN